MAKPLYKNLRLYLRGEALEPYYPQKYFLSLIGTAARSAVAARRWPAWHSPLMWKLKVWIDRHFMRKFEARQMKTHR